MHLVLEMRKYYVKLIKVVSFISNLNILHGFIAYHCSKY